MRLISRRPVRRRKCCTRSTTRNGARSNSATPSPCSPTGRARSRSPSSTSASSSRRRSACTWSRTANREKSSTSRPISTCRPIPRRTTCRRARALPDCASRNRATGRSTGARTTGSPSSAPPISAPSASFASTACRRAAWRSTSRSTTGPRNSRTSPSSTSTRAKPPNSVTLYALMEGPSIVGAYRFLMTRGKGVIMDIESSLFVRAQVSRFGIAPVTSMYWYSETKKPEAIDWRPEVHDSDGLEMWSGARRAAVAAAQQPAAHHGVGLLRQQSARLRAHAARPRVRPLPRRRRLRPAAEPVGRAAAGPVRRGLGQGIDPALRDPDRRRDPRQCRGHVGAGRAGAGGGRAPPELQALLAGERALSLATSGSSSRPGSGAADSPASRARRACASSWSSGWAARSPICRSGSSPSSSSPPRAGLSGPTSSSRRSPTTSAATGGRSST